MPLTKTSYSMIAGAPINVLDFGADNTGAVDSTTAINDAIQYAKTNSIQSVVFPYGEYTVSGKINVAGNFGNGILIEGNNCTITSTASTSIFYVNATLPEPAPQYKINATIQNFNLVGKDKTVLGVIGVEMVDVACVSLMNVNIENCYRGLYGYGCLISDFIRVAAHDCYYGFQFLYNGNFAPNDLNFSYCKLYGNTVAINHLDFPNSSATYIGCEIEGNNQSGNTTDAIRVTEFFNAGKVTLIGCHFEANPGQYNLYYSSSGSGCGLSLIGCELVPGDSCGTVLKLSNVSGPTSLLVQESRVTNNVGTSQITVDSTCSALIVGETAGYVTGTSVLRIINGNIYTNDKLNVIVGGPGGQELLVGNRTGNYEIEPGTTGTQSLGSAVKKWKSVFSTTVTPVAITVANLAALSTLGIGTRATVTDANATTYGSVVAGGGANVVPVFYNGTNWIIA